VRLLELGCTSSGWQVGSLGDLQTPESGPSAQLDTLLTGPSCTTVCQLYPPGQRVQQASTQGQSS